VNGSAARLVVGLDVGGSRSRGRLCDGGRVLAEAEAGAANAAAVGHEPAERELRDLLDRLCTASGRDAVVAVCAGVAGADSPVEREQAEDRMRRLLPNARVRVVHDARLVLAAAGLDDGITLIASTGSIAYGWAGGHEARAGGWGHLLGDEGSGYWVVREGVRRMLADDDAERPPGPIARALLDATGCRDAVELMHRFHERRAPGAWAMLAGAVLAAAPEMAVAAGHELAGLGTRVAERLGLSRGNLVLAGGLLLHQAAVERSVREELALRVPGLAVARLTAPPVVGAVRLAAALSSEAET
jgi:glucosamine kinase